MTGKNRTSEHFGSEVESVIPSAMSGGQITKPSVETYATEPRKTNRRDIGAIAGKGAATMETQRITLPQRQIRIGSENTKD